PSSASAPAGCEHICTLYAVSIIHCQGWRRKTLALHACSGKQHLAHPTIDIVVANDIPHEEHALALLIGGREKRLLNCGTKCVRIVRVHRERLGHLTRCSGKRSTVLVRLGCRRGRQRTP